MGWKLQVIGTKWSWRLDWLKFSHTWCKHVPSQPNRAFLGDKPLRLCFCMWRAKHEHSIGPNKHSHLVDTSHTKTINTKQNEHDKLKESRTQSTLAVFYTTYFRAFFSNPTPINLFGTAHKNNIHQISECRTHLTTKQNLKVLNKTKTKSSASKKRTLADEWKWNQSVLCNENGACLSQKQKSWDPTNYCRKQN